MKTLRLIVTEKCHRNCEGCCNKQWDIKALPVCRSFEGYDEIILTGGEPLRFRENLIALVQSIKRQTESPVYIYTAFLDSEMEVLVALCFADGITLTLHEMEDIEPFLDLNDLLLSTNVKMHRGKSLRLNVFRGVDRELYKYEADLSLWEIKDSIVWLEDCPLPDNETLMRLEDICG